ncbi:hypothetical protein [Draconibacterium halophilum]|uniref:Uncharacterized protein n=1 Tax=Draconibacterium halophilum TaxID=2706887 RepID=A0A6C0RIL6_9BACT|nr:hypothetical protein [Draconibacterium halophilum]QIA08981.1 hypothetical protein G0Q07_15225 [Draconibacterium halophilum]
MEEDKFYNNIQKALDDLPENFSILEEQIDVAIQMKYLEFTKLLRSKDISEECFDAREELFDEEVDEERKKEILTAIAVYDDVKAYRTLEKYVEEGTGDMKQWGTLALQESRMLMHSSLLDEQQVFISTGLGGKGKKLRYFVVFLSVHENEMLSTTQQKLLKDELIFELNHHDGVFESMDFMEGFSSALVMLPITVEIKDTFQNIISECNQYGGFLREDMVITNVKVLSRGEIIQLIHQKKNNNDELEEE